MDGPVRLRATWQVRAGVIPGRPIPEYTKEFHYTSQEHVQDEAGRPGTPQERYSYHAVFSKRRAEAMDYYMQMSMPQFNNWAEITFIWY